MGLEKINELKKNKGLTNSQLSKMTGITISTIDKITSGSNTNPKLGTIKAICQALGCTLDDLMLDENERSFHAPKTNITQEELRHIQKYRTLDKHGKTMIDFALNEEYNRCTQMKEKKKTIIEISRSFLPASAGSGEFLSNEFIEKREYPDTPISRRADIVIPVSGNSMEPMFYDGDEMYVRLQPAVEVGEIGIFILDGNGYVKEFAEDRLVSINPDYDDIYPNEFSDVKCVGKVLGKVTT